MKIKCIKFEDIKIGNVLKNSRGIMVVDEHYVEDNQETFRGREISNDVGGFYRFAKPRGKCTEIPRKRISRGSFIYFVSESLEKLMAGNSNSKQEEIDRLKKKIKIIEDRIKNIEEIK